jgi:peptide/nickel transport system permease protein
VTTRLTKGAVVAAMILGVLAGGALLAGVAQAALGVSAVDVDPARRFGDAAWPHLLGTDALGRDLFTRLLLAGRVSLLVATTAAVAASVVGIGIGIVAAATGGVVDALLMRTTDALIALPTLPLLLVVSAADMGRVDVSSSVAVARVAVLLAALSWMTTARLVRAEARQVLQLDHVAAARALGASERRVLALHVLPLCLPSVIVQATLAVGGNLLAESGLSFLGLGVPSSQPSWGAMLTGARDVVALDAPSVLLPGVLLFIAAVCVQQLGDGLRDVVWRRGGPSG